MRAKSPSVRLSPSPNMMMPRATGSAMVVNGDMCTYWRRSAGLHSSRGEELREVVADALKFGQRHPEPFDDGGRHLLGACPQNAGPQR